MFISSHLVNYTDIATISSKNPGRGPRWRTVPLADEANYATKESLLKRAFDLRNEQTKWTRTTAKYKKEVNDYEVAQQKWIRANKKWEDKRQRLLDENNLLRRELTTARQGGEQSAKTNERIDRACVNEVQRMKQELGQAKAEYNQMMQMYSETMQLLQKCQTETGSAPGRSAGYAAELARVRSEVNNFD